MPLYNLQSVVTLPTSFTHWHDESMVVTGNPLRSDINTSFLYGVEIYQNPPAINDSFKFSRVLQAGNYRLRLLTLNSSILGKLKLEVNNVLAFDDLDCYNPSPNLNVYMQRDIVIASDGLQEFKFTVFDKHPSATNYYFSGRKIWGYRL
ncbi:hypothetical protein H6G41_08885 [Tolypothrix sp. FACHB-123]|uniref:hypothetical protein n=1 Tax=Tolypothrix sp. FACHB-123 TaxID=2692868 RepID=UPI001681DA46|nr:hypothetical protein [Tolypothrix sp. FACHB-123]MBD2354742.1 hypothetical protein [Tolypothrix sp. FACHB-123]